MPRIEISLDRIPFDQPIRVENDDSGIVVVRTARGLTAYEDVCPHAQWRLSDGEIINGHLECPGHGWEFDVASGECATVPAYCLRRVRIEIVDEQVVRLEWDARPVRHEKSNAATNR